MLDAQHVVVANQPQLAHDGLPRGVVVTVADGAEDPRPVDLVTVVLGVQHAVDGRVLRVHEAVLGVEVLDDRPAQEANGRRRERAAADVSRHPSAAPPAVNQLSAAFRHPRRSLYPRPHLIH